jgi:hypothetical protein
MGVTAFSGVWSHSLAHASSGNSTYLEAALVDLLSFFCRPQTDTTCKIIQPYTAMLTVLEKVEREAPPIQNDPM